MTDQSEKKEPDSVGDDAVDVPRREALARLGRYGAYTAPALLGMLISRSHAADFSGS